MPHYGASVPPHGHQPTTDLPMTGPDARPEGRPRTVPAFTITRSTREVPSSTPTASPTPQTFNVAPPASHNRLRSLPPPPAEVTRCNPSHLHQVGAGETPAATDQRRVLSPRPVSDGASRRAATSCRTGSGHERVLLSPPAVASPRLGEVTCGLRAGTLQRRTRSLGCGRTLPETARPQTPGSGLRPWFARHSVGVGDSRLSWGCRLR